MLKPGVAKKLVITINEADSWHGKALYDALLDMLRRKGLAGATAIRAIAGFTGQCALRSIDIVDIATHLPVRIEVVDSAENIERVLPDVYDMVETGLVEVQDTQVVKPAKVQGEEARMPPQRLTRQAGRARMLSIHLSESARWEGEPLHEAIVKRARALDIAGATVYRGVLGYGAQRRLHKHRALSLSSDDPLMVCVIDSREKVDRLLEALETMVTPGCLVAVADVDTVRYE